MYFVGSVKDPHGPMPTIESGQRCVVTDTGRAVYLNGAVDDCARHLRGNGFDLGNHHTGCSVAELIDGPGGFLAQQSGLIDFVAGLGYCLLNQALIG